MSQSVTDNVCGAISVSFIFCGEESSFYTALDMLFQTAASQGQSVFIATGDWGAAGLRYAGGTCVVGTTRNPSEMATSPHVTAVGGTTFSPQYQFVGQRHQRGRRRAGRNRERMECERRRRERNLRETHVADRTGSAGRRFPRHPRRCDDRVGALRFHRRRRRRHCDNPVLLGRHESRLAALGRLFASPRTGVEQRASRSAQPHDLQYRQRRPGCRRRHRRCTQRKQ